MARSPASATDGAYNHAWPSDRMTRALAIVDEKLAWRQRGVLAQVAKHDGTAKGCTASLETIAAELKMPHWKLCESLKKLTAAGYLSTTPGQTSSTRRVVWPDESHCQENPDTGIPLSGKYGFHCQ